MYRTNYTATNTHPFQATAKQEVAPFKTDLFDADFFREHAETAVAELQAYLTDKTVKGLNLTDPFTLLKTAEALMTKETETIAPFDKKRFRAILNLYIKTGIQVHSPGYMGRQFSGVVPLAGVFDMVNSVLNQPSSFYEAAQLPNVAERIMSRELNRFIGYEEDRFTMVTTSGGSLANLTALLAARNNEWPDGWKKGMKACHEKGMPAIAVSEDTHYSITRAAGILGIGENQLVRLPVDASRKICIGKVQPVLDEAKRNGLHVFCLVASAGTTSVGAIDPLDELAGIARRNRLWMHVDGAHGASLLVSDRLRPRLKGIEKADSLTWDAHKMLFVPSPCSLLFYKEKEKSYGAFHQEASYVFEKQEDIYTGFDSAGKNFECTKRPLIMNLWVLWAIYGRAFFSEKIEYLCRLCKEAYKIVEEAPDFETIHRPESNILCFRYKPHGMQHVIVPDFQTEIRNRVRKNGTFFISKVDIDKEAALRVVFMNHEIRPEHIRRLLHEIREAARGILGEKNGIIYHPYPDSTL